MYIFIDESGTFTHSPELDSWCVVAAHVISENKRRAIDKLVLRVRAMGNRGAETKLKNLSEDQYVWFLKELEKCGGLTFAVGVDVGLHSAEAIVLHRDRQADKVVEHQDKMIHEAGRIGLRAMAAEIRSLPPQLYTQLICQLELFQAVLMLAPLYFVQRHPPALAHFRWRLDQKARVPVAARISNRPCSHSTPNPTQINCK